jgi:DNA (cytosine-5)-methyltransferase 1
MKFLDFFCGAGGFSIGLAKAGHELVYGIDNWNPAELTYKNYFGNDKFKSLDLSEINPKKITNLLDIKQIEVDLIVGGPPCQGFSSMGKQNLSDPRNKLVINFAEIISVIKPEYFILENVSAVQGKKFESLLNNLTSLFKDSGYTNLHAEILDAQNFNVPQRRKRFFLVGCLSTSVILSMPKGNIKKRNVGEAIMDLVGKENSVNNHVPMNHNEIVRARLSYIPEGGKLDTKSLPRELAYGTRSDFRKNKIKNFSHIYQRLSRDKISGTIVPGHNAFPIHPTEDRSLTVREAARIQTFPDKVKFFGTRQEQCILVGNAVPVNLSFAFGKHLNNLAKKV